MGHPRQVDGDGGDVETAMLTIDVEAEELLRSVFFDVDDGELTSNATQKKPRWCTSCKKQRLSADFDPDRKTCRECLRKQRRRKQRQSRERLKQKVARETLLTFATHAREPTKEAGYASSFR